MVERRGRRGVVVVVGVRNFARKQGFAPRLRAELRGAPSASDSEEPKNLSSAPPKPTERPEVTLSRPPESDRKPEARGNGADLEAIRSRPAAPAVEDDVGEGSPYSLRAQAAARYRLRPERKHLDLEAVRELAVRLSPEEVEAALAEKLEADTTAKAKDRKARTIAALRSER